MLKKVELMLKMIWFPVNLAAHHFEVIARVYRRYETVNFEENLRIQPTQSLSLTLMTQSQILVEIIGRRQVKSNYIERRGEKRTSYDREEAV